jgi:RNA 2',3'-cyclic 3'-phosphodiesterase
MGTHHGSSFTRLVFNQNKKSPDNLGFLLLKCDNMEKRLFIAIKIKPEVPFQTLFQHFKTELKDEPIKWTDIQNIHLTLKFLGETPISSIKPIIGALSEVCKNHDPFRIKIKGCGRFGSSQAPKVLWLGIENQPTLLKLVADIDKSLSIVGFNPEPHKYSPHLTLGRFRSALDNLELFNNLINSSKEKIIQHIEVNEIILFESQLQKSGPKYSVVKSFTLLKI